MSEGVGMSANTIPVDKPEWASALTISRMFGLSRSTLYELAAAGKIRSASLRDRGKKRGKRLFSTDSVSSFIESRATGGIDPAQENTKADVAA